MLNLNLFLLKKSKRNLILAVLEHLHTDDDCDFYFNRDGLRVTLFGSIGVSPYDANFSAMSLQ